MKYMTVDGLEKDCRFLEFLAGQREAIAERIFRFIPRSDRLEPMEYGLSEHWHMVADYPERGGKYIRPGLVLLSCHASGGDVRNALTTAAAMEISEDWLLVHDDFEDGSLERRGRPCLHRIHGEPLAVNAGDHLHLLMWKALLANHEELGCQLAGKVCDKMLDFLQTTCEGQYLELSWTRSGRIISEDEYYAMIDRKTGWYTVIGPLQLGALIAGNDAALGPLVEFGRNLGRAFQIHDDWLNVFSTSTGKELGGDILEGKRTLLLIRLVEAMEDAGDGENLSYVRELFRKEREKKSQADAERVISLYERYGCREAVREEALRYAATALELLKNLPYTQEGKEILGDAVDLIVNRDH